MFQFIEPVWSLHLSKTSSCWISVRSWIKKSGQLLLNKWMVWKWAGFWYKGFTVCDTRQYTSLIVQNEHAVFILHVHVLEYTLQSDNYRNFQWGKERKGEEWGNQGTYYTIHLRDSRSVTRNYVLFLVDYADYKKKNLVPAPTENTAMHPEGSNGFSLALFLCCVSFLCFLFPHTLLLDRFSFLIFFFSFLPLTKCAVPRDLGKLFHVSLLFDIAAVWSATLGRPRPI